MTATFPPALFQAKTLSWTFQVPLGGSAFPLFPALLAQPGAAVESLAEHTAPCSAPKRFMPRQLAL